ncbi:hypothetical protein D0T12_24665 [Actinomadura spongiicola]|uniref:Uncharacterized protein n=1 Tax=Actinomadura spongiicola TaxID=2303421 RepID=A0A372GBC4_9ACTN|nr:hypothetical protein [Actinomadura spongiicola]RFS82650.1 hypothetical protein D0T12_24665 [Actinomadura spongiicola]
MTINDRQVEALHVQLAGRPAEEHLRLFNALDETDHIGYAALLAAGLFEAIQRRFVKDGKVADRSEVIDFIATVRARSESSPDEVNPDVAERIILHALGQGSLSGIDSSAITRHQIILLAGLVAQARYNEAELNAFMRKICADAEEMLE